MIRRALIGLVAVIASSLALFSCQQTPGGGADVIPVIKVPREVEGATGGSQFVKVAAGGQWTLSVVYTQSPEGWIHLNKTTDTGNASVDMTIDPNEAEDPRKANLVLTAGSYEITKVITQLGKVSATTTAWLELPAFELNKNLFFGTHSMDGSAYVSKEVSGDRNWSFLYDYDAYVSWWVAYPLNSRLRGSGSRSDMWQATDPLLPANAVCDLSGGSYGGGWTRGHQIPSADRLDYEANITTFYPTNMTPQDYDFNCEIWAHLEDQVRSYAFNSDTLYVVTGADIRSSTTLSGNKGGHRAKVPTHYYKALLRKKGSNYSAVGYYLQHSSGISSDDYADYACSITELESKTGIDFFVNLPALLGKEQAQAIEDASPSETLKNW